MDSGCTLVFLLSDVTQGTKLQAIIPHGEKT
jgi:hypothetical protein